MSWEGRFAAAKKVALAMESLIRTRYPRDYFAIVGFFTRAVELKLRDLPEASWNMGDPFTNLQDGLRLGARAARAPSEHATSTSSSSPTASRRRTSRAGRLYCEWPLSLRRHQHARRAGDAEGGRARHPRGHHHQHLHARRQPEPARVRRAHDAHQQAAARSTRGPDRLGEYLLVDYIGRSARRSERARRWRRGRREADADAGAVPAHQGAARDAILLFRLGDFYEMFFEDAERGAAILDLTLTAPQQATTRRRSRCAASRTTAVEPYIAKLLAAGLKVAICEQVEDPRGAKGLIERDVVRVDHARAPILEEESLDPGAPSFLAALAARRRALRRSRSSTSRPASCGVAELATRRTRRDAVVDAVARGARAARRRKELRRSRRRCCRRWSA